MKVIDNEVLQEFINVNEEEEKKWVNEKIHIRLRGKDLKAMQETINRETEETMKKYFTRGVNSG